MPAGNQVRPYKWSRVIDLYDDGVNSAIWGSYENDPVRVLGVRYNDDYPNQGGNSLWYVEPDFVTKAVLLELLNRVIRDPNCGNLQNIIIALQEHQ